MAATGIFQCIMKKSSLGKCRRKRLNAPPLAWSEPRTGWWMASSMGEHVWSTHSGNLNGQNGRPGLFFQEGSDFHQSFFSSDFPTIGAFQDHQLNVVIWTSLPGMARDCSEARPSSLCNQSPTVTYADDFCKILSQGELLDPVLLMNKQFNDVAQSAFFQLHLAHNLSSCLSDLPMFIRPTVSFRQACYNTLRIRLWLSDNTLAFHTEGPRFKLHYLQLTE